MKQLFLMVKDGSIQLLDTPAPTVKDSTVIVETLYSVVSAGTERSLTSFGGKNLLQKAMERPDQVRKVTEKLSTDGIVTTLESAFNRLSEPMPMGYSGGIPQRGQPRGTEPHRAHSGGGGRLPGIRLRRAGRHCS